VEDNKRDAIRGAVVRRHRLGAPTLRERLPHQRRWGLATWLLSSLFVFLAVNGLWLLLAPTTSSGPERRQAAVDAGDQAGAADRIGAAPRRARGVVTRAPARRQGDVGVASAVRELRQRRLRIPVATVGPEALDDHFDDPRGSRRHEAIDIMVPRHTPVVAVDDGHVARLLEGSVGGLVIYQVDPSGRYAYYYAHLERYAEGLEEGAPVRRGDLLGFVGTSGNAPEDAPHLHFSIHRREPGSFSLRGEPINPFAVLGPAR
jgi:murein DD-endopeptidase MepM/ murein hydrolase activator NlpD